MRVIGGVMRKILEHWIFSIADWLNYGYSERTHRDLACVPWLGLDDGLTESR